MIESIKSLEVEFIYTTVVNYAIQQNKIPIIKKFVIENLSERDLVDLNIEIKGDTDFINCWEHKVEIIREKQRLEIEVKGLKLSANFLSDLTERLSGELILSISSKEENLFAENYNIDILAYDQWCGAEILPEILAAFVTPNHPEISKITQTASKTLESWTGDPSFDAYQSLNPDRVKKQIGSIFEAIASLGIVYCTPPASFEKEGQRIRMCDTIFSQKLATCIDMVILYASCIEAIGLNPLIIIINGHAFVGAWLKEDMFSDSVKYDSSLLKKRTAPGINEIVLIESTFMNAGQWQSFDEAIASADYKLVKEEDFVLFIDIKRARYSKINPLPQRIKTSAGWEIIEPKEIVNRNSQEPNSIISENKTEVLNSTQSTETKFSKQKLWERKLLDLSLRNNLLNLRTTQSTIQLLSIDLGSLEDALANGDEFHVLAKPSEWLNPNKNSGVYQTINMSDPVVDLLKSNLSSKRLNTYLTNAELKSSLSKLHKTSRLSLEENGANTLYLALGFLKWYESPNSELARYAPILLLPIEIIRKSAQKGYVIRSREEETLMNITLLEMLKQEFNINITGLGELPRDDSGVDVTKIFNIIRREIMAQSRWNLEEHAFLGIFSFSKFIMWNDIHNNADKLTENKIINSLISGKLEWKSGTDSNEDLDKTYYPSDIALSISADSTQMEAICAAAKGESFILHGPPGTGKSQTITNIIANTLYQGKRVLFVAEKMAALTVVQKRLANIGLANFCLELHSNKSKKSNVLEQFKKTTEIIQKTSPVEFKAEAETLYKQRTELNGYVDALHQKRHFGYSLYDSFSSYAEFNKAPDNIPFEEDFINDLTKEKFIKLSNKVEELQRVGILCGHPFNHPLSHINTKTYNHQIRTDAQKLISKYIELLNERLQDQKILCELLLIETSFSDIEKIDMLEELTKSITFLSNSPAVLINIENPERNLSHIIELAKHGEKRDIYRYDLLNDFTKDILLERNAESTIAQWNRASNKWVLPKLLGQYKISKKLRLLSKTEKVDKDKIVKYFKTIICYQEEQEVLDENAAELSKNLDFLWNNGNCEWTTIIQICETSLQINQLLLKITEDTSKTNKIRNNLANLLCDGNSSFFSTKDKLITKYIDLTKRQKTIEEKISELLKVNFKKQQNNSVDWIEYWKQNAENWLANLDSLRDWTSWNRIKEEALNEGLSPVIKVYLTGELKDKEVLASFKKSLFKCFSEYIISKDPRLSDFIGKLFEGKINKFKEQCKYFEELTKAELFAKLASKIPLFAQDASNNSENGILQRAIRNNGRAMSIRHLFDLIPNLLPKMCPCMLMSPISVAQYIDIDKSKFDLIIFDEASQMPTYEAVGAIARGQNVIVVGDPKQMPPTSFFSTNHYDEENADKEDMDSILEDCITLSIPSKHLLWHYRSKHESLIAFSNSNYYENKLLTFPSPDDLSTKVTNVPVVGYYDRGKTRQNSFEAEAIVSEVLNRLSDPILSQRSIGIVTFSSVQQTLIEDKLNDAFVKRPDLEKIAMESTSEPIFVKNLENIQGDERDVILFSVCYGPDQMGKIYLNFGPLNRKGGWRRLNVAISRARYEMKVFSTLRSDQIDISRTSSDGVAEIKAFLEYTEKGKKALPQKENTNIIAPHFFEKMVADEIQKLGYTVQTDIGCSGYRIDIGIVNPEKPSEYILGILTDGETYRAAKTAKDREVVQSDVLKSLGWNIYKLWSPDWWDNPQKVIEEITNAIKEVQMPKEAIGSETQINHAELKRKELASISSHVITQEVIQPIRNFTEYKTCVLEQNYLGSSDELFAPQFQSTIISQINQVIEIEAPISHSLLSRRILNSWGISRLGVKLNEYLTSVYLQLELKHTIQNGTKFYWSQLQDPDKYDTYRVSKDDEQKRNAEDLAKEEIRCGIKDVLLSQVSLPKQDLIRETAKVFGYARVGGNVEQAMKIGIDFALKKELITNQSERIVLKQE